MDINENQKAVSKNLRNTLNADLLWSSKNYDERAQALRLCIAQRLGEDYVSPFCERIVIGENEKSAHRCITIETIQDALKRTDFFNRYDKKNEKIKSGTFDKGDNEKTLKLILPILYKFFERIKKDCQNEWENGLLATNNGAYSLILVLNDIINHLLIQKTIEPLNDSPDKIIGECESCIIPLIDYLNTLSPKEREELKTSYGGGGKAKVWRYFQKAISDRCEFFKPDGLSEWWQDNTKLYNTDSFSMLDDIESIIKKDFKEKLEEYHGNDWFKKGLPKAIFVAASEKAAKRNYDEDNTIGPWDCVTINDCREIAIHGSNWKDIFEDTYVRDTDRKISGGKSTKTEWLEQLSKIIKNKSIQTYSVSEKDYNFIKNIYDWLHKS